MKLPHNYKRCCNFAHARACAAGSLGRVLAKGINLLPGKREAVGKACLLPAKYIELWMHKDWLKWQHSIHNIVKHLGENGPIIGMRSWPTFTLNHLLNFRETELKFCNEENRGLHTLFYEKLVIEAQIRNMEGYKEVV